MRLPSARPRSVHSGVSMVFRPIPYEGERFLASFAIPGVPAGLRNTTEDEIRAALNRSMSESVGRVAPRPPDSSPSVGRGDPSAPGGGQGSGRPTTGGESSSSLIPHPSSLIPHPPPACVWRRPRCGVCSSRSGGRRRESLLFVVCCLLFSTQSILLFVPVLLDF